MAKKMIRLSYKGFERLGRVLDKINKEVVKTATETALMKGAEKVQKDVKNALAPQFMPHGGMYSRNQTEAAVIVPYPEWEGTVCSVPIGFDFTIPGHGGFLIKGTPKMRPNPMLHMIFLDPKYTKQIKEIIEESMKESIMEALDEADLD